MEFTDYYQTLGVDSKASEAEIKTAYRRLARKYHPDVSKEKGAETKFKSVNEAYEVLKDSQKRSEYDQYKSSGYRSSQSQRPGSQSGNRSPFEYNQEANTGGYSDFFESLFGQSRRNQSAQTQQTNKYKLSIALELVVSGGKQKINIENRMLEVNIPAGIQRGQSIRLANQGVRGGDLLIEIDYAEHPEFELDGLNVLYTLSISPWEAVLGTTLSVPTLAGVVALKIPENSDSGKRLRLKGRGLPSKTVTGDQLIELEITTPAAHTEQEKNLYREMKNVFAKN